MLLNVYQEICPRTQEECELTLCGNRWRKGKSCSGLDAIIEIDDNLHLKETIHFSNRCKSIVTVLGQPNISETAANHILTNNPLF
jgi:hypothetical protein